MCVDLLFVQGRDDLGSTAPAPATHPEIATAPAGLACRGRSALHPGRVQSTMGAMIWAKLFRARFSRLFTVPRLHPVISAISSYVLP